MQTIDHLFLLLFKYLTMYKIVILILVASALAKGDIYKNCDDSINCAEENLIKLVDELDAKPEVPVYDESVVVEKTKDEIAPRNNEDFIGRVVRYLSSHELKFKVPPSEIRSIEERSRKLKKLILPLLLVLKLKAAIIIPAVLSLIALVAFKGLGASLMALAIAGATAFKGILEGHVSSPKVSYEVVPQISAHLWNRAGIESYPLGQGYHTIS